MLAVNENEVIAQVTEQLQQLRVVEIQQDSANPTAGRQLRLQAVLAHALSSRPACFVWPDIVAKPT
jgi:hypothetical protein